MAGINTNNKFWKQAVKMVTSGKTSDLLKTKLPDSFTPIATELAKAKNDAEMISTDIENAMSSNVTSYQGNTDETTLNDIKVYQDRMNLLQSADQSKYDTLLHEAYSVSKLQNAPEGFFSDYYLKSVSNQYDVHTKRITANHESIMTIQNLNSSIMDEIISYQNYIMALQTQWQENTTQQISSQVEIMRQLQDQSNTEKKKTSYLQTDIIDYDNFIYWLQLIVMVLIIFLIGLVLYQKVNWSNLFSKAKESSELFSPIVNATSVVPPQN